MIRLHGDGVVALDKTARQISLSDRWIMDDCLYNDLLLIWPGNGDWDSMRT